VAGPLTLKKSKTAASAETALASLCRAERAHSSAPDRKPLKKSGLPYKDDGIDCRQAVVLDQTTARFQGGDDNEQI
jgi:hypothetical protein